MKGSPQIYELARRIENRSAVVGVCGLGYVGLPLAITAAEAGFSVIGLDIDSEKAELLNRSESYIDDVASSRVQQSRLAGRFRASSLFSELSTCDIVVICVPTPLTKFREPDLSFVELTAQRIAEHLRDGQLVILESTSFPGTTHEVLRPILESSGQRCGVDFLLAFSPERQDPGNREFATQAIPKVVAGEDELSCRTAAAFYRAFVSRVVCVSNTQTAEAVKLTENIFRAVNIALVNELKVLFTEMGIDIWEVIEAAKTKPFGYMPFFPGPGLGGHCIPIDPFYLTWKAREYELSTRFIELAGEINSGMPRYVVDRLAQGLNDTLGIPLKGAEILIIGAAYKKNVSDTRESPSLKLIELLEERQARIDYHDPHVPVLPKTRHYPLLSGRRSVALTDSNVARYHAVLIAIDHDRVDYELVAQHARLIVDTRNVLAKLGFAGSTIIKA